jgi:preprotein translocase subunit Sss1
MEIHNVVVLVIGVATFLVGFVGLVIKLIELGRK